ncbi:amidohydrolase family protein [bacterium]|nr:amidohydrolase family protein [bacterium]
MVRSPLLLSTQGSAWDGFALKLGPISILIEEGIISEFLHGLEAVELVQENDFAHHLDLGDRFLTPGLVDAHTHLLYGGDRSFERELRESGASYLEILEAGGGIHATVNATTETDDATLLSLAAQRLQIMRSWGTTTVETKTGYGLLAEEEMRHLRLYQDLKSTNASTIVPTYLGAHALPKGECRKDHIQSILRTLHRVAEESLSTRFDLFLERGAYRYQEADTLFRLARSLGFDLTLHAGQFSDQAGGDLALRHRAASLDHGEFLGSQDGERFAEAGVAIGLLPTCNLYLETGVQPQARKLIDHGVSLFLGTDHNPGSSPTLSLLEVAAIAHSHLEMSTQEILLAMTSAPARVLGLPTIGCLTPGAQGDVAVWNGGSSLFGISHQHSPLESLFIGGVLSTD